MIRRVAIAVAAAAVLAVLLVLLVHAPFVRARVLSYALARVEADYGLRIEASRLDYNLARLRIGLADVRMSAFQTPDQPFFESGYVSVVVPWRSVTGGIRFDDITATDATVRIVRDADGATNLPESSAAGDEEPAALQIAHLGIPRLSIEFIDTLAGFAIRIPAASVDLADDEGRIALAEPATIDIGERTLRITRLESGASFDGRTLRLTAAEAVTDEATVRLDGTLTLIARDPSLDLAVDATGDIARLAAWAMADGELPTGSIAVRGDIDGPMADPRATLTATSPAVIWQGLTASDASATAAVTSRAADLQQFQFTLEGGRIAGQAAVPFNADAIASAIVSWTDIPAIPLVRALAPGTTPLPATVISGTVDAQGPMGDPAQWVVDGRLRMAPLPNDAGRVSIGGNARLLVREGSWRLDGDPVVAEVAPTQVLVGGPVEGTAISGMVTLARTGIPALIAALAETGLADVPADTITAGSAEGEIRLTGTRTAPRIGFTLRSADQLVAQGQAFDNVQVAGSVNGDQLSIAALTASQPASAGTVRLSGTYDMARRAYDVTADIAQWAVTPTADLPARGIVDGSFAGTGTLDAPGGEGRVMVRDAAWDTFAVGGLEADVRLADGNATIDASAPAVGLAVLLTGIETPVPVSGTAAATVHAEAPIDAWRTGIAIAEVQSLEALAGDLPVRLVEPARFRYVNDRVVIERAEAAAGEVLISASGEIAATDAAAANESGVLIAVTGDVDQVARAVAATGITELPITGGSGPIAVLARVSGSLQTPVLAADIDAGPGSIALQDLPPVTDITLRARLDEGQLDLRQATATFQGARVSATGDAPLVLLTGGATDPATPDTITLFARVSDVSASVLEPFLDAATVEQLSGSIDATVDLSSTTLNLEDVSGTITLDRMDIRIADLPVAQRIPTRIVAGGGFARVEAWDWTGQGATLAVRGQVRLSDRQAALLADGTVDMRLLTPFVRDAGLSTVGTLRPRLSITGPIESPRIDGDLSLTGGEIRLADPRIIVSDLTARAALSRTTATMTSLTGSANGGPLTGSGSVELLPDGRMASALITRIRAMALEFPEGLRSEVDSDLTMALTTAPEGGRPTGSITGTVTLVRGSYREPMAVMTGLLTTLRAQRLEAEAEPSPVLDALALNIRIVTDEDLIVDNNYGRFQLGADLRLIGTASVPALSGRAELREGGQLFVGRNIYEITAGTIDFANPTTIEPELNIQATTRAGGIDIEVTITGTPETMAVDLAGSDPDEGALGQAELASLLLTGRRFDDLAPGDAAFLGTQVLGNFSAEVLGFAGRAIGFDTVRLGDVEGTTQQRRDPTAVATEIDPTTRLTFGKAIGANVDVTFSQSLRDSAAQTWIVEYLPIRRLELRFVSNDENMRSVGFRHDVTFGGAPRAIQSQDISRTVRPDQRVAAVQLTGTLLVPEPQARQQLRLEPGDRFDFGDWQDDRDRLEQFYRRQGRLTARVVATRSGEEAVTLVYDVTPGPRTTIIVTGIDLTGTLRAELEDAWTDSIFDEFLVEEAQQVIRDALAADRYTQPSIDARVTEDDAGKTLTIAVVRGPRAEAGAVADGTEPREPASRVSGVTFAGDLILPVEQLRGVVNIADGAPYDAFEADTARSRLVAAYRIEGFSTPMVELQATPRTPTAVDLVFTIEPGPRQMLQEVVVSGNRAIDADVITRAIDIEPGTPLTATGSLRARTRIFNTGLFRRVDVATEAIEQGAGGGGQGAFVPMRLRVTVEEWPALRLRYGFQVAEERPEGEIEGRDLVPGLSADITRRTLFGRALATGAAFGYQPRERRGRLFLNAPTLLGWPVESSLVLERSREEFTAVTLVTDSSAIAWEQRARLAQTLTLAYAYRFERNHTFDTEPDPNSPLGPFDITVNIARLTGSAAWDTRDDPSNSRRGWLASSSLEYAPESVGSEIQFLRQVTQGYYFKAWRGVVFASAARLGMVRPLGGQDLIPSEKFFAGGARTVRGVAEDSLGERNFFDEPAGGEAVLVFNQEARVPLYKWLGGVAFVDAGNVFTRARDLSLRGLVGSLGVGLRLDTPFALLRADYARPAWGAGPAESAGRWTFGIGQAF